MNIPKDIVYLGAKDTTLDLFEGQYPVPNGITYNSFAVIDEQIAVFDTIDVRKRDEWLGNLANALGDRLPNYLIISHMEPDHSASVAAFAAQYPSAKIAGNIKTLQMLKNFTNIDYSERSLTVADGSELSIGAHTFKFFTAPMVHWPEVMVTYEISQGTLFSADAFGRFGTGKCTAVNDDARRYYFNIVGKYGAQVLALFNKLSGLSVNAICPLHGPVLTGEAISEMMAAYAKWASYEAEEKDTVTIAVASIYGNTKKAAKLFAESYDGKTELYDLSRCDMSEAVAAAFKNGKLVLASSTYDGGIFMPMDDFLRRLKHKGFQNRKVALMENGSWAPQAAKLMRAKLEQMKNISVMDSTVKIVSAIKPSTQEDIANTAKAFKEF